MTLDELIVRVRVAADGADGELDAVLGDLKSFAADAQKSTKGSADMQAAAWAGLSAAAGVAFGKICEAVKTGISASNEYKAAIQGLSSVSQSKGIGDAEMTRALESVTDAFFTAQDAATSYKNLLSRGYTLEQATQAIMRLKDAAAFGRQSSLSLGDAVRSATEGLKNENSILIDNAGVTKNVSVMWKEYAASIGVGVQSLTQAQKVEAEYQGIMRETQAQVGDLSKLSDGLAGKQAEAAAQRVKLAQEFGDAMTPVVSAGTELFTGLLSGMTGATEACPALAAGLTTSAAAMTLLITASAGLSTVKRLLSDVGFASGTLGWMGVAAAGIGLVAGALTALSKAQEDAKKAEEERKQAVYDAAKTEKERLNHLEELGQRYDELSRKTALTLDESAEMSKIRNDLAKAYGLEAEKVGSAAQAHNALADAISKEKAASLDTLYSKQNDATWERIGEAQSATEEIYSTLGKINTVYAEISKRPKLLDNSSEVGIKELYEQFAAANGGYLSDAWGKYLGSIRDSLEAADIPVTVGNILDKAIEVEKTKLKGNESYFKDWITAHFEQSMTDLEREGVQVPDGLADGMLEALLGGFDISQFDTLSEADTAIRAALASVCEAFRDPEIAQAAETLKGYMAMAMKGLEPSEDAKTEIGAAWTTLFGEDSELMGAMASFVDTSTEMGDSAAKGFLQAGLGLDGMSDSSDKAIAALIATAGSAWAAKDAASDLGDAFDWVNSSTKAAEERAKALLTQYDNVTASLSKCERETKTLKAGQEALNKAKQKGTTLSAQEQKDLKALGTLVGYQGKDLDVLQNKTTQYNDKLTKQTTDAKAEVQGLSNELANAASRSDIDAEVQVQCGSAVSALQGLLALANVVLGVLSALGVAKSKGGGGGGGKNAEEEAAKEAERLRKEAIERDYNYIEHLKAMEQLSLEQEIEMLERMYSAHALNAEEIMALDEKVFDARKRLRERDAGSMDSLYDGLQTALENRYQSMLDAETEQLDQSRKAWEQWAQDSVKAIQAQIDALEQLSDTEDREAKDAQELRKIEKLKQEYQFEQDDYSRAKIAQQIEQAEQSRAERLRKMDISDQKAALQKQQDAIREQADSETGKLDEQQAATQKAYAERMKAQSLAAEAEKLLMGASQKDILSLIGSYAPEYDALGKTLGERLLDGFTGVVGNVKSWFESMNEQIFALQENMKSAALSGLDGFYQQAGERKEAGETKVELTVNFNEPVQSESQVTRRIEQTLERAGSMLTGGY